MSDDEPDDTEGRRRRERRRRVTLKWNAVPLALPGEDSDEDEPKSAELELPSLPSDALPPRPSSIPPPNDRAGADGWERQLPRRGGSSRRSRPPFAEEDGDALSLVEARSRPSQPGLDLRTEMHERLALGDFTAALSSAELLLGQEPDDAEALDVSRDARARLAGLYVSRLGGRQAVPRPLDVDVRWLGLDHRAGYLLSRIDGQLTVQGLLDLTGLPELEVLRACVELLEAGAIEVPEPR